MKMISDEDLLQKVEQFLTDHAMAVTRFGRAAMGEASLVSRMREGRSLSLRNANKLLDFMASHANPIEQMEAA